MRKSGTYSRLRKKYSQSKKRTKNRETSSVCGDAFVVEQNVNSELTSTVVEVAAEADQNMNQTSTHIDHAEQKGNNRM